MKVVVKQQKETETDSTWIFTVSIREHSYTVTVDRDHWRELTGEKSKPADLVKASFAFLLDRESAEEILSSFNLRVISNYFPEYTDKIKEYL